MLVVLGVPTLGGHLRSSVYNLEVAPARGKEIWVLVL